MPNVAYLNDGTPPDIAVVVCSGERVDNCGGTALEQDFEDAFFDLELCERS